MGYGPIHKGKHTPITPYKGSWAETVNKTPMNLSKDKDNAKQIPDQ